jgi:hypothetical protein
MSEILLKMYIGLHVKYPLVLSDLNEICIFENDQIKFHENPSSGRPVAPWGRTDGQTDMTKLTVTIPNFANAPKNAQRGTIQQRNYTASWWEIKWGLLQLVLYQTFWIVDKEWHLNSKSRKPLLEKRASNSIGLRRHCTKHCVSRKAEIYDYTFRWVIGYAFRSANTGWSKSLCALDDYSTEQSPHNWWVEDGHHRIHSECGPCCTEHGLREHNSACQ